MKGFRPLSDIEQMRLLEIRLASKRGTRLTDAEQAFCQRCWARDPERYSAMNDEIARTVIAEMRMRESATQQVDP